MTTQETGKWQGLLTDRQAAEFLGLALQTVRNFRFLGIGPAYHRLNGRSIRYSITDLQAYVDQAKITPDPSRSRAAAQ